jgi:hypothetical protein
MVAPRGGYGFGPRHLDFHPTRPQYLSLERQNMLEMDRLESHGPSSPPPLPQGNARPINGAKPRQAAGTVHVHPSRFVYGVNRADSTIDYEGKAVFAGGQNTVVMPSIRRLGAAADSARRHARHSLPRSYRPERPVVDRRSYPGARGARRTHRARKTGVPVDLSHRDRRQAVYVRKYDVGSVRTRCSGWNGPP